MWNVHPSFLLHTILVGECALKRSSRIFALCDVKSCTGTNHKVSDHTPSQVLTPPPKIATFLSPTKPKGSIALGKKLKPGVSFRGGCKHTAKYDALS